MGDARCRVSEPTRRRKKSLSFNRRVGGVHEGVCVRRRRRLHVLRGAIVAFVLALQCDFLTVMMWGLHKLTDSEGENENKDDGRRGRRERKSHGVLRGRHLSQ